MSLSRLGEDRIQMTCWRWFSALGGFKTLIGKIGLILGAYFILPCLAPLVLRSIKTVMEAITERKTAAYVMMLWKYKFLDQDDAL
jgi:ABC-type transporter lipoprotein component MlaA